MTTISTKTKWVATDGWRGYVEFINAVAGANDTGTWDDSPCPTPVRKREVAMATSVLRKNKIPFRTAWERSSNVFMNRQQILVAPENRAKAIELLLPLKHETRLLWVGEQ